MEFNLPKLAQYPAPVRLSLFLITLLLVWLPLAAPIYLFLSHDPNLVTILTMGMLFGEFVLLLQWWGKHVYQQPQLLNYYGLKGTRQNGLELLKGLGIGLLFVFGLFALEGWLGWLEFQTPQTGLPRLIVEGSISALGIGWAEELVFRGWLLEELQRDYNPKTASWADSTIFAVSHYLKPLSEVIRTFPGFPGRLLLGWAMVWAKRSSGGLLGLPIGLHAGLVWGYYIINVGKLVQYSDRVSPWITGVDGDPVAGIMGLLFLGVLAVWMRKRAESI